MNNTIYIMVGLPGSGKTTYAKEFIKDKQIEYLSSDELRAVFGKNTEDQNITPKVFEHIKKKVDEYLKDGKNVLVDATSINRKDRSGYIKMAKTHGAKVTVYLFRMDREGLIARNQQRGSEGGRNVATWIIDKMFRKYEEPSFEEGIDVIIYV